MKKLFVLTMALVLGTSVSMAQGVTTKKVETENRTSLPQAPITPTAKKKTVGSKTGTQGWMSDDIVMPDKPVNEKTGKTVKTAKTVGTKTSKTVGTKTGTQGWMSERRKGKSGWCCEREYGYKTINNRFWLYRKAARLAVQPFLYLVNASGRGLHVTGGSPPFMN